MMFRNTLTYLRHQPSRSVGFLFTVSSLLLGIWVAALPQIKSSLGFSDATLGLSLLLAPIGALTGVVVSPFVFKKVKVGPWLVYGHLAYCFIFLLQVLSLNPVMLWLALFGNGLIGFLNGVSTNAIVDQLEKRYHRHIMSTSHGMYSTGGFVSAGLAAIFYSFHLHPYWQISIVAGALVIMLLLLRPHLLGYQQYITSDSGFRLPSGSVVGLAFICFVAFMGEGSVADWSAIYLKESLLSTKAVAGLGFAGFSIAMAIGRLNGDAWIPRVGSKRMAITGSLTAAAGFLLAIAFHSVYTAIAGFTLIGLGFCCIVPILFSAAARVPGVSPVTGISAVASGGLIGFLAGPSLIGLIAEKYSVAGGLSLVFVLAVTAAVVAWKNEFLQNRHTMPPEVNYRDEHA